MIAENINPECVKKVGNQTFITIDGETKRLCEWSRLYGISWQCILGRVRSGWDWEVAIVTTARTYRRKSPRGVEVVVNRNGTQSQHRGGGDYPGRRRGL